MRKLAVLVLSLLAFAAVTASASASTSAAPDNCVTLFDFPDAGEKVCVYTEGPCVVGEYRTTIIGTEFNCIVDRPGARAASVDPIPPCVREVISAVPGFALRTVQNFVENGELPRIMGPFLPC